MATRNLTRKFVEIRNGAKATRRLDRVADIEHGDNADLLHNAEDSSWQGPKTALPPVWVDKIEQIEEQITKIQEKMRELSSLHTKRLMVNFESDETEQERDIDQVTQKIHEHFRTSEALLKKFSKQTADGELTGPEISVRNNMQKSMAKKLQGLSTSFRGSQKEYMSRLQAQKSGAAVGTFDYLSNEPKKTGATDYDSGFNQAQMLELENLDEVVNQRDEEIVRIAKSIEELAQIFKELAVLVIDQGTILDRIDFNMEQVIDNTGQGLKQLEKAEEHQKNAMAFRCIIVLVILIVVMVAALIGKHADTSSKN